MTSRSVSLGVTAVLVASLVLSSTVALLYYEKDQQAGQQSQNYVQELDSAIASYRALSANYNASLSELNKTLVLFTDSLANLNTSTPAYATGSMELSSLWDSYQNLASVRGRSLVYSAHLLVDYGNGTFGWYNSSMVQPGWNGYVLSLVFLHGNVQAQWYPSYGEHYVTGVNSVSQTQSKSWFFWERSNSKWEIAPTGADGVDVFNGTTVAWALCGYDQNYIPSCTP